jgi:hypothetical protein
MPTPSRLQYSHRFTLSKGTICAERNRKPLVRDCDYPITEVVQAAKIFQIVSRKTVEITLPGFQFKISVMGVVVEVSAR